MKKYYQWFFSLVILGILVWGLITPSGIRAAWANNTWSTKFVNFYYKEPASLSQLTHPPSTHIHGKLFLIQQALQQKNYDLALNYINPPVESSDQLAMDAYVAILYLQEDYTKALEIWGESGNVQILEQAALDLVNRGRQDLALLGYQTLYRVNPEKYASSFAVSLKNQGDLDKALQIFQKSINEYPNSEFKHSWLRYSGDIYRAQKKFDEAKITYMEALKANPMDARSWRNLGLLYSSNFKNYEQAAICFEKMIEVEPDNSFGYFLLGQTHESAGLIKEAVKAYNTAIQLNPEYTEAQQALERLTGNN